ncbi:MAG: gliding motility-associated C-terminal domain-containing protein, partial [Flavobacteriales bacterium]|nr:gliding motility-associated C-terminal domain-containing protein [Flavobacteriales bacterium]
LSPEIIIDLADNVQGSCVDVFELDPTVSGGVPGFDYSWSDADGANLGTATSIDYQSFSSTTIYLEIEDQCGGLKTDSVVVTIVNPQPVLEIGEDIYASCIDLTQLNSSVEGGVPDFDFEWIIDGVLEGTGSSINYQSYETVTVVCEIVDACGSTDTDSLTYYIPDIPVVIDLTADTSICLGSAIVLHAVASGGEEGFSYFWPHSQQTEMNVQVDPTHTTIYEVQAMDICGTLGTAEVEVEVQSVEADFEMNFLSEIEVMFTPITDPDPCENCEYYWDFGDGTNSVEMTPLKEYDGLSLYTAFLTVTNELGCYDIVHHVVDAPLILYVPNSFTPDGDGINDEWFVVADGVVEFELFIFDRWGEVVWHTTNPDDVWVGGTEQATHYVPNSTYTYLIKYRGVDYDAQKVTGTITILR